MLCAVVLSLKSTAGLVNCTLKTFAKLSTHRMSLAASTNAQYSASVEESVTFRCLRDFATNGPQYVIFKIIYLNKHALYFSLLRNKYKYIFNLVWQSSLYLSI